MPADASPPIPQSASHRRLDLHSLLSRFNRKYFFRAHVRPRVRVLPTSSGSGAHEPAVSNMESPPVPNMESPPVPRVADHGGVPTAALGGCSNPNMATTELEGAAARPNMENPPADWQWQDVDLGSPLGRMHSSGSVSSTAPHTTPQMRKDSRPVVLPFTRRASGGRI